MPALVVGIGEILFDIFPDGKKLGGAPANFAYHASQLGLQGCVVSAIGNDKLGQEIIQQLKDCNIQLHLEQVCQETGQVLVETNQQGIPSYNIKKEVAYDYIPWTSTIEAIAKNCQAVCFGTLAQRNSISRNTIIRFLSAMSHDGLKIYDINLRQHFYNKEIITESLKLCNILKINDEELQELSRLYHLEGKDETNLCTHLLENYSLKMVILTCGIQGSWIFTSTEQSFMEATQVEVADTVGAGDSFTSAICCAILDNLPIKQAHHLAVETAAYVCTKTGAMPKLPSSLRNTCKK